MPMQVLPLGPFGKGIVENASPSEVAVGAVRFARNIALSGGNKVIAAPGTEVAMTFTDDTGGHANITSIRAVQPFGDHALVVGYSSVTQKVYLYRVATDFTGWYTAGDVLTSTLTAQPVGVLWPAAGEAAVTVAPDVTIAEGLGTAFFATPSSLSAASLNYRLRSYTIAGGMADVTSNLDGTGAKPVYALGCISYQSHLWIWGYGSDSDRFRPELLRFSGINYDPSGPDGLFNRADSFTIGDRIRSKRERVVMAGLAGEALIVAGTTLLARITGYGRDTWFRSPLDKSFGVAGPKAGCAKGGYFYYWSPAQGPMRVGEGDGPEMLWPRVDKTAKSVPNASTIVVGYDDTADQALFVYDSGDGAGVCKMLAYDPVRDAWFGPDSDLGLAVACAGIVERVLDSTVVLPPPTAPNSPTNIAVGISSAIVQWVNTSAPAQVEISIKTTAAPLWSDPAVLLSAGTTNYSFTGLTATTQYDWRVRAFLNGQYSSYATASFTTATPSGGGGGTPLLPPTNPSASTPGPGLLQGNWTNGEPTASTEMWYKGADTGGVYMLAATRPPGAASYTKPFVTVGSGVYTLKFRHVSGGSYSSYTAEVTTTI